MLKILEKYQRDSHKHSKDGQGIENLPVFDKYLIHYMEILNIPELHNMLGIGRKLYDCII